MPYTPPTVAYVSIRTAPLTSLMTQISGVISVSFERGRQRLVDDIQGLTAIIEFYGSAFGLTDKPEIGTPIVIGTSDNQGYFSGYVTDIERTYGIPYKSGVGPEDRIVVRAAGALALAGAT